MTGKRKFSNALHLFYKQHQFALTERQILEQLASEPQNEKV